MPVGGPRTLTGEQVLDAKLRKALQLQYETFVAKEELQDFEAAVAEVLAGWFEELGAQRGRPTADAATETGSVEEGDEWTEPPEGSVVELPQAPNPTPTSNPGQGTAPGRVEQGQSPHQGPPAWVDSVREAAGWSLVWGLERGKDGKDTRPTRAATATNPSTSAVGVRASTEKNI